MADPDRVDYEPVCNGICIMASEVLEGSWGGRVAYAHPDCELHGWGLYEPAEEER